MRLAVRRLAGPAVTATLLQGLFNIADTFWVGQGLGAAALAGVSTGGFLVWLTLSLAEGPAVGLVALASRRHGEGSPERAARAAGEAFRLSLLVAAGLGAGGLLALDLLFDVMLTPAEVTREGAAYLAVYLSGTPVVFAYLVMDAVFRAAGDTRTPLYLLVIALGLNFALDPFLILGPGPFPRLGVAGAALATLLTRGAALAVGLRLLSRRGLVRAGPLAPRLMGRIGWIGAPVAAAGATFALVYVFLTRFTSQFGTAALAALGVGHKVESLAYMACLGFGVAAATAVGQNLGAGRPARARQAGRVAVGHALVVTAAVGALFLIVPGPLMAVFTRDPAVIEAGVSYLRIVAVSQPFMALEIVLEMAMDGAGYTLLPMAFSVTLTALRLPLAWVTRGPLGLAGIWWTISLTTVARGVAAWGLWRRGGWRERQV